MANTHLSTSCVSRRNIDANRSGGSRSPSPTISPCAISSKLDNRPVSSCCSMISARVPMPPLTKSTRASYTYAVDDRYLHTLALCLETGESHQSVFARLAADVRHSALCEQRGLPCRSVLREESRCAKQRSDRSDEIEQRVSGRWPGMNERQGAVLFRPFLASLFSEKTSDMKSRPTTVGTKIRAQTTLLVDTLMACRSHCTMNRSTPDR